VRVTPSAAASLGLAVGQVAYLAVKSHSVRLV
jgi:molybdopterin-binding protein